MIGSSCFQYDCADMEVQVGKIRHRNMFIDGNNEITLRSEGSGSLLFSDIYAVVMYVTGFPYS